MDDIDEIQGITKAEMRKRRKKQKRKFKKRK